MRLRRVYTSAREQSSAKLNMEKEKTPCGNTKPDSSFMKKLDIGARLKKIQPSKAQPVASRSSPKKNIGSTQEKMHSILAQPVVAASSSKVNLIQDIKKIRFVTRLPEKKEGLQPVNVHVVKNLSDLMLLSSKKSDNSILEGFAKVCTSKILQDPKKEIVCQSSGPSTSSGVNFRELYTSRTWIQEDNKYVEFSTKEDTNFVNVPEHPRKSEEKQAPFDSFESQGGENLECGDKTMFLDDNKEDGNSVTVPENPQKSEEKQKTQKSIFELIEMTELPENIFDSSDDETSDRGYARVGDGVYNSFLTNKQKKKEDRLTKAYTEGGNDSWEFCGKGSSDIEFTIWPPQGFYAVRNWPGPPS